MLVKISKYISKNVIIILIKMELILNAILTMKKISNEKDKSQEEKT